MLLFLQTFLLEEQNNSNQPGRDIVTSQLYQMQSSKKSFMVMFYSDTCPHCHQLMPIYVGAAKKLEGVVDFVKFSCSKEENAQYCYRTGINAYPLVLMLNPAPKDDDRNWYRQFVGERDQATIINFVQANMIKPYIEKQNSEELIKSIQGDEFIIYLTPKKTVSAIPYKLANQYTNSINVYVQANITEEDKEKYAQTFNLQNLNQQENTVIYCNKNGCSKYEGKQKAQLIQDFIAGIKNMNSQTQETKKEL